MGNKVATIKLDGLSFHFRGKSVILDSDLARLYGVPTKRLNEAVKRNIKRFPPDFLFKLTASEVQNLRSHFATSSFGGMRSQFAISSYGGRRYLPYVFTEHGILMLSSVLKSETAVEVNIRIMRVFVQMRRLSLTTLELKRKIDGMEKKYDSNFKIVFDALRHLIQPEFPTKKKPPMGFTGGK